MKFTHIFQQWWNWWGQNVNYRRVFLWLSFVVLILYSAVQVKKDTPREEERELVYQAAGEVPDVPDQLYAQSAVLMDADSGRILFDKDGGKARPMASTTKIMTCILTLEQMKDEQKAVVSDYAASQPRVKLGAVPEEKFYVKDLLYSLMLESHNDTAVILAETIGGSVEEFAKQMNQKAAELGCNDTHFVTPNGLDAEDEGGIHSTTAADLARIMRYCIMESPKKEEFLEITRTQEYSFTDIEGSHSYSCSNHNAFLSMMDGALSGKTGFTGDAGYCYVGALRRDERTFIVALLACGWPNNRSYKWKDTKKLMEYACENYEYREVWKEPELAPVPVVSGVDRGNPFLGATQVPVGIEENEEGLKLLLRKDETPQMKLEVKKELTAPVSKNQAVGTYQYYLEGELVREYPVVTLEAVRERTLNWCMGVVLERFLL